MSGELIRPDIGVRNQLVIPDVPAVIRLAKDMDLDGPAPIGQSQPITETGVLTETVVITEPQIYTRVPEGGEILAGYIQGQIKEGMPKKMFKNVPPGHRSSIFEIFPFQIFASEPITGTKAVTNTTQFAVLMRGSEGDLFGPQVPGEITVNGEEASAFENKGTDKIEYKVADKTAPVASLGDHYVVNADGLGNYFRFQPEQDEFMVVSTRQQTGGEAVGETRFTAEISENGGHILLTKDGEQMQAYLPQSFIAAFGMEITGLDIAEDKDGAIVVFGKTKDGRTVNVGEIVNGRFESDLKGEVTATALNVRKEPNGKLVGLIRQGEQITITGISGNWYEVVLSDGTEGVVSADWVQANPSVISTATPPTPGVEEGTETTEAQVQDISELENDNEKVYATLRTKKPNRRLNLEETPYDWGETFVPAARGRFMIPVGGKNGFSQEDATRLQGTINWMLTQPDIAKFIEEDAFFARYLANRDMVGVRSNQGSFDILATLNNFTQWNRIDGHYSGLMYGIEMNYPRVREIGLSLGTGAERGYTAGLLLHEWIRISRGTASSSIAVDDTKDTSILVYARELELSAKLLEIMTPSEISGALTVLRSSESLTK